MLKKKRKRERRKEGREEGTEGVGRKERNRGGEGGAGKEEALEERDQGIKILGNRSHLYHIKPNLPLMKTPGFAVPSLHPQSEF